MTALITHDAQPETLSDLLRSISTQIASFADRIDADPDAATLTSVEEDEGEEEPGKPAPEWARKQHHVLLRISRAGWVSEADFRLLCQEAGYKGKGTGGYWNKEEPLLRRENGGFRITRKGRARLGWIVSQGYSGLI